MAQRTCRLCGFIASGDEIALWFQSAMGSRSTRTSEHRRSICIGCRQTNWDVAKRADRFLAKARSTLKRHAAKFGYGIEDFCLRFGWTVQQLAHDLRFQYANGCSYCHKPYQEMGHGLQDITVDIVDRKRDPYYGTNTKLCCGTCNRAKGDLDPQQWDLKRSLWRRWQKWVDENPPEPPPVQLGFAL